MRSLLGAFSILVLLASPASANPPMIERISDDRLARILALSDSRELLAPPQAMLRVRLYQIPVEGSCVPETHWVCAYDYFVAVNTIDSAPDVAVYSLGRIGEIAAAQLVDALPGKQATLRFETRAYPSHVLERLPELETSPGEFFVSFVESDATLSR